MSKLLDYVINKIVDRVHIKGDINWWKNFQEIARAEDGASNIVTDPMQQHAWFNIAVKTIYNNIARIDWKITFKDKPIEETDTRAGMAVKLFRRPNPYMSRFDLFKAIAAWRTLSECILTFGHGDYKSGIPETFWIWNPANMTAYLNTAGDAITMWKYKENEKEIIFLPSEVIHFKDWNKWDDWRGVQSSKPLVDELNQDVKGKKSNNKLLDNNAILPGIIKSEQRVSEDKAKEIKARWTKDHAGYNKHYVPGVMDMGFEWQNIAVTPKDMSYSEMFGWNRETILAYFGVPGDAIGIGTEGAPLSGERMTAGLKVLWNLTLIPHKGEIEDKFNQDFFERIGLVGYKLLGDISQIPELQENDNERTTRETQQIQSGRKTVNELREAAGEEPVPWGDTWYKTIALQPWDKEPEPIQPFGGGKEEDKPDKEKPEKSFSEWFNHSMPSRTKSLYDSNPLYRNKHWWAQIKDWENIEDRYKKQIQDWLFGQRSRILEALFGKSVKFPAVKDIMSLLFDDAFWKDEEDKLKKFSEENFINMMETVGANLSVLFEDLQVTRSFNIYDTRALQLLKNRVNKGKLTLVTETVRDAIREELKKGVEQGLTETEKAALVKGVYNGAQGRSATIARTELGNIINDSRVESFHSVGFKKHSWLSAQDGSVRVPDEHNPFNHLIDGETVIIGQKFSNGLRYPNDPEGEAGNVINCRCLTMPED